MWMMTRFGYYSVATNVYGKRGGIVVRGRVMKDLDALKEFMGWSDADAPLVETPNADYPYRLEVSMGQWMAAASALAGDVDYPKFKPVVAKRNRRRGAFYVDLWGLLLRELSDEDYSDSLVASGR